MATLLAHAGHGHGTDLNLPVLLAVALVIGAWAAVAGWRARRR